MFLPPETKKIKVSPEGKIKELGKKKIPSANCLVLLRVVIRETSEAPKVIQALGIPRGCPAELYGKTLL